MVFGKKLRRVVSFWLLKAFFAPSTAGVKDPVVRVMKVQQIT